MATTSFPDASPRKHHRDAQPALPALRRDAPRSASASRAVCTVRSFPDNLVITSAEPEFARPFGLSSGEICGYGLLDLLHSAVPDRLREQFVALSSGRQPRFTEKVTGKDGTGVDFHADMTAIAVRGLAGGTSGAVVLLHHPAAAAPGPTAPAPVGPLPVTRPVAHEGPLLSALDAQVLEGVARGESTVQLASRLYLSRQGIEYRIGQMLRRFDTPNRPALVSRAHALGMFAAGQWPPRVLPERVKP
ncbi:LuxR family transcriptional regulator [Streptomyces longwoodensis]|uniref:LuxR family transcriptional regulator n=1 Tax=Streptomyces longwoodensis TaxID=68231 RepID=A0A124HQI2_9ACTN|nr:LuxR C-terminal-related transcriptional regulator [Streptomyces longwoodensis]KUN35442.1 LuxR family transcriptional regulator [Streptomyces longwoodensis]